MDGQSVVLCFDGSEEDMQEWYDSIYNNITLLNQQEVTITQLCVCVNV